MSAKPALVFVPGFWLPLSLFDGVRQRLTGFETEAVSLSSTGQAFKPGAKQTTMVHDVETTRAVIAKLVEQGKDVVLVGYSGGGIPAAAAPKGLLKKDREAEGKKGGVTKLLFITAAPLWQTDEVPSCAFQDEAKSYSLPKDPRNVLFNDLSDAEAEKHIKTLQIQAGVGHGSDPGWYAWREGQLPTTYLICERDNAIPVQIAEQIVTGLGYKSERIDAGHVPWYSKPDELAEYIAREATTA